MVELIEQAQWIALDTLKLWTRNYNQGDVGAISNSIKRFGFNKSVRAWNGVVMAGNHSIKALRQLQVDGWQPSGGGLRVIDGDWYVSVIDVSHLSEQEAEAFAIADNRTAELASHDDVALAELLQEMALADMALMRDAGYDGDDLDMLLAELSGAYPDENGSDDGVYTRKVEPPIYTPSDSKPVISDLYNDDKTNQLVQDIQAAKDLTPDEKQFLAIAAQRHTVLNFSKIADYYAHSNDAMKRLMQDSALVIIDYDRAIELGFVRLSERIAELYAQDYPDE